MKSKKVTINVYTPPFMLYRKTAVNASQDLAFDSTLLPVKGFYITHQSLCQRLAGCISKLMTWHSYSTTDDP